MVTKMKMFGFMPTGVNAAARIQSAKAKPISASASASASASSNFNMKNLASIMNVKNTGCKSCRG